MDSKNLPQWESLSSLWLLSYNWAIWKCGNNVAFDGKKIKHPAEIFIHACSFMSYWVGLLAEEGDLKWLLG
jgi:hypothetical protein